MSHLLKKAGLDVSLPTNYRPISNLSFLSKLLERVIYKQTTDYLIEHKLFPEFQSAYRRDHSTETAVLKVFSDIIDAIEEGQLALLSLLDLSAAFDTVDRSIMREWLERSYGVGDSSLRWFESYLTGRSQSIHLGDESTVARLMTYGVPQGSVLGPLLFTLYTGDVGLIMHAHGLLHHCYADDTHLYFFCKPSDADALKDWIIKCIGDVAEWMASNRLKLNPAKSEFFMVCDSTSLASDRPQSIPAG